MEDSLAICFGSMEEGDLIEYIMLQAPLPGSSEEMYLEVNDQSTSLYGGIISANLSTKELSLELSETAVKELGLEHSPAILAIKLSLSSDEVEELTYALTEVVFKDDNNFSIEK